MRKRELVGLILLLLLFAFYFVSMFGLNWMSFGAEHMGLWQSCTPLKGCVWMETTPSFYVPFLDWYSAVRAFVTLAIIFDVLAIAALVLNICAPLYFKITPTRIALSFNVLFYLLTVIIFPLEKRNILDGKWSVDWTYYFTCLNLVLTILVCVYFYLIKPKVDRRKDYDAQIMVSPSYQERNTNNTAAVSSYQPTAKAEFKTFSPDNSTEKQSLVQRVELSTNKTISQSSRTMSQSSRTTSQSSDFEKKPDDFDSSFESDDASYTMSQYSDAGKQFI